MDTLVDLICENCGCSFTRRLGEVNRNKKQNRKTFCNSKCQGKIIINNIPNYNKGNPQFLKKGSESDLYSPFRRILLTLKQRQKENPIKTVNISLQDLKDLWDKQNGICPYTGWSLVLPKTSKDKLPTVPERASLDRIDSKKGYTIDNVQFVALIYQYAKNTFDNSAVQKFCRAVVDKQIL